MPTSESYRLAESFENFVSLLDAYLNGEKPSWNSNEVGLKIFANNLIGDNCEEEKEYREESEKE